jgi:SAM-dependent methyltransferase
VTAEPGARSGPGPLIRAFGRAVNSAVARFPWSWRLLRGPVRRFFDSVAVGWDERVRSDSPEYLMPLRVAFDRLPASPGRILDIGTGTGAAALELADRYPDAEVVRIDVSAEMVAQAGASFPPEIESYRAFRFRWKGQPQVDPALAGWPDARYNRTCGLLLLLHQVRFAIIDSPHSGTRSKVAAPSLLGDLARRTAVLGHASDICQDVLPALKAFYQHFE